MNQKVNHISLDSEQNVSLNNVKGRATIKLFDADGHEVYSKTDDNLVTNAVSDLINSGSFYQMINATTAAQKYNIIANNVPLSKNMFGGLLLFKDAITEDATKYMLPRNSICVGAAGNGLSSEVDRGSFNPTESEQTENGCKFVWDFTTSQCNGDISAIALTSILCGNSFKPNAYTENATTVYNFSSYSVSAALAPIYHNPTVTGIEDSKMVYSNIVLPFYISPIIGETRYIVFADKMNMKIIAYRLRTLNVRSISDTMGTMKLDSQPALQINLSTLSPAPMSGVKTFGITVDGEGFYIIYPTGTRQFAKKHYIWDSSEIPTDFDIENPPKVFNEDTTEGASATVATTFDLYNPTTAKYDSFGAYDSESGNYYIADKDYNFHIVDGTTGNEIAFLSGAFNFPCISISACGSLYTSGHYDSLATSAPQLSIFHLFFTGTKLSDGSTTSIAYNIIRFYEDGASQGSTHYHRGALCPCYISDGVTGSGRIAKIALNSSKESVGYYITVFTPAVYLATINNITPVTKTNATSMKVIYEIYDVPDEDMGGDMSPEM